MVFKRFSLRGFSSEFDIRREIDEFEGIYICSASLYTGRHIRRKVDSMSSGVSTARGIEAARAKVWGFRNDLIRRYRLKVVEREELTEAANRS